MKNLTLNSSIMIYHHSLSFNKFKLGWFQNWFICWLNDIVIDPVWFFSSSLLYRPQSINSVLRFIPFMITRWLLNSRHHLQILQLEEEQLSFPAFLFLKQGSLFWKSPHPSSVILKPVSSYSCHIMALMKPL